MNDNDIDQEPMKIVGKDGKIRSVILGTEVSESLCKDGHTLPEGTKCITCSGGKVRCTVCHERISYVDGPWKDIYEEEIKNANVRERTTE